MNRFISLHEESLYLQGARDLLLRIQEQGGSVTYSQVKEDKVYSTAIFNIHRKD